MIRCDFCNEITTEKKYVIQASAHLHICCDCVDLCIEIKKEFEEPKKEE